MGACACGIGLGIRKRRTTTSVVTAVCFRSKLGTTASRVVSFMPLDWSNNGDFGAALGKSPPPANFYRHFQATVEQLIFCLGRAVSQKSFVGKQGNNVDVLVVGSDQLQRFVVDTLQRFDWSAVTASDWMHTRSLLTTHRIGVLLLDINHIDIAAIDFNQLRGDGNKNLQVILLAAETHTLAAIEGITRGADGHLPLPVAPASLKLQVGFSLARYHDMMIEDERSSEIESVLLNQTLELQQMHVEVMKLLSVASCYRDHETGTHNQRVGMVSGLLAKSLGWTDSQVEEIRLAALMHDIGKLAIPDMILRKPGKLTAEEYRLMQMHTIFGDEILAASKLPVLELSRQIAISHHEKWDGTGYPYRLEKWGIPEAARIVAIADVYDALTHDRIYRAAMSEEQALQTMSEGRGTQFDPEILDTFFRIKDEASRVNATILERPEEHKHAIWKEIAYNF